MTTRIGDWGEGKKFEYVLQLDFWSVHPSRSDQLAAWRTRNIGDEQTIGSPVGAVNGCQRMAVSATISSEQDLKHRFVEKQMSKARPRAFSASFLGKPDRHHEVCKKDYRLKTTRPFVRIDFQRRDHDSHRAGHIPASLLKMERKTPGLPNSISVGPCHNVGLCT